MARGLLLFAHGARDPRWALPFEEIVQRIATLAPERPVQLAFLEFMAPTILEAGDALVARGCDDIEVVPLFLGAGGHVRKDLPDLLARLRQTHPGVTWLLRPAIGEIDSVIEAMARAALGNQTTVE